MFILLSIALPGVGQITIERDEFPRAENFLDTVIRAVPTTVFAPSEGPDQIWDYSMLSELEFLTNQFVSASGNADFPNALNYEQNNLKFQVFIIPSVTFEAIDDEGWYEPGRFLTDITYSIAGLTGGPNDSLRFVGGPMVFDERLDMVRFPLNYGDEWEQTRIENGNFELSVAAFGLNHTPGTRKRYLHHHRKVAGYGQLTIPAFDGSAGAPTDVLMIKVNRSTTDSIFLAGAPAPPPLMAAFGLTQGSMAADSFYVFYRQDFGAVVLNVNLLGNNEYSAFYRPQSLDAVSATREFQQMKTTYFPNPIRAGQVLTLQTDAPLTAGYFNLTDALGRVAHRSTFEAPVAHQIQVRLPVALFGGMYMYQLTDKAGRLMGTGKLKVD